MQKKIFPVLYALASNGKVKEWHITVTEKAPNNIEILVQTGYIDGKKAEHTTIVTKGKNIGRANETTPWTQALSDAQSDWNKKKNRQGFQETIPSQEATQEETLDTILPMLAKKYDAAKTREQIRAGKKYKGIYFPAAVQPKYDGIRSLAKVDFNKGKVQKITFYSRTANEQSNMPHLEKELAEKINSWKNVPKDTQQIWLDGEFYHPDIPFSTVNGLLGRKNMSQDTPDERNLRDMIQYWMFDLYLPTQPDLGFREREKLLASFPWDKAKNKEEESPETGIPKNAHFQSAPLREAKNPDEVDTIFKEFIDQKYEGLMLRNWEAPYAVGQRSTDLQKYKPFDDAEFTIIGFTEGTGDEAGLVLWELEVPKETNPKSAGRTFIVRPTGTHEERAKLFAEAQRDFDKKFKGKKMTVRFDGWTSKHMPRDPRGIGIRWDLD